MGELWPDLGSGASRRRDRQSEEGWGAGRADTVQRKPHPNPCRVPLSDARTPWEPLEGGCGPRSRRNVFFPLSFGSQRCQHLLPLEDT